MSNVDVLAKDSVRNLVMPISVAQYHKLNASGLITDKTELIEGIILRKMTKSPLHTYILNRFYRFFADRLDTDYLLRKEDPLTLVSSEPEPDISIVRGRLEDFIGAHPRHAELVIEVAVASLELDREKAAIYASAGIPEYWIVIPADKTIERYIHPSTGRYQTYETITGEQTIDTLCGALALRDIFVS